MIFERRLTKRFVFSVFLTLLALLNSNPMALAEVEKLSQERLEARQWYQDAKFGVFLHWGIYSLMAGAGEDTIAEWVMQTEEIPVAQYEQLADFFNPTAYDADKWADTFAKAGARYVIITAKHHDGFAMYHSKVSDYNVVEATPFGRDVIGELKTALDKRGIRLFLYYSQLDWRHPDYFPRGRFGHDYTGRDESQGNWDNYLKYQDAQVRELLTQYGDIAGIWFDGWWDRKYLPNQGDWRLQDTYNMIREIQPGAIISNNHHIAPFPNEDTQLFEQDLPGECNFVQHCTTDIREGVAFEMVETINGSWGFHLTDSNHKSSRALIQRMVGAAGRNANFTLNTGPLPNGKLQAVHVERYMDIGQWLRQNGESIYKTRGGPLTPRSWGVTTQTEGAVYVHILDLIDTRLSMNLPADIKVRSARYLSSGKKLAYSHERGVLTLTLDREKVQALQSEIPDLIVKLEIR